MKLIVIGQTNSGKSTLVRALPQAWESDLARTPDLDAILKPLRRRQLWAAHNAYWWPILALKAPQHGILLFHSIYDAEGAGRYKAGDALVWLTLPLEEALRRAAARGDNVPPSIVEQNYETNRDSLRQFNLAKIPFNTVDASSPPDEVRLAVLSHWKGEVHR
jgi:GTPase SAR1 family protein